MRILRLLLLSARARTGKPQVGRVALAVQRGNDTGRALLRRDEIFARIEHESGIPLHVALR